MLGPDHRLRQTLLGAILAGLATIFTPPTLAADEPRDHGRSRAEGLALFREEVRPILVASCLDCHGGKAVKGGFDLSTREHLVEGGMIDGEARETRLYALISHADEPKMPQKAARLPDRAIDAIARWIDRGSPYEAPLVDRGDATASAAAKIARGRDFWSFRPLQDIEVPAIEDPGWARGPIDRFIRKAQQDRRLRPNKMADRRTWIRRLTLDLIGLPPTPAEVDAFLADPGTDDAAVGTLVDRLLSNPGYGEKSASAWLDVARFAESFGYEQDYDRPHAYPYRDFLIRAYNANMPWDQLARWQVAGDELAPDDPWASVATGFLGGGAFPTQLTEAEFESARYDELDDMASTTSSAFLGLTVGCARCHDHKFDPIPTVDYYRLASAFTETIRSEIPLAIGPKGEAVTVQVSTEGMPHTKHHADERGYPHFYPTTHILERGDVCRKGEPARPGFLRVLMAEGRAVESWAASPSAGPSRTSRRRAALAQWMTDPDGGAGALAARVVVNRSWQGHFGRGLVATPNDFGAQGERPTHPELLEWLAADFVRHGWDVKRLHRAIATSSTYLQDSRSDDARLAIDRSNEFHWRRTPRRIEAEAIRDSLLAASGRLDPTLFGPSTADPASRRRSVYTRIKRSQLDPVLTLFDWPEHLVSIGRRSETTTGPQSLFFLNDPIVLDAADGLASGLVGVPTGDAVRLAHERLFGRPPSDAERAAGAAFLDRRRRADGAAGASGDGRAAMAEFCRALMSSNEFIYVD